MIGLSNRISLRLLLLLFFIGAAPVSICQAQQKAAPAPAQKTEPASKPNANVAGAAKPAGDQAKPAPPQEKAGAAKPAEGGGIFQPEDVPVPINAEKLDEAGQALGKQIETVGKSTPGLLGRWINANAFGGISFLKLFVCVGLLLLVIAADRALRRVIDIRLRKCEICPTSKWRDLLLEALAKPLSLFVRVYGIYWALSPVWIQFDTPAGYGLIHRAAGKVADFGGTVAFFWFIYNFLNVADSKARHWAASTDNSINDMLAPLISKSVKGFVVVVGGIMVVQNMTGIEIGPLLASLGIGGLAFALAGKDSIANFLGSLTILFDKPFQVGERIIIDKHDGFVEGVGFRSTRIRTLTGNLVSIPNEKIINSPLENIARRTYLRWSANFGLVCSTPPEKVERAVEIIGEILDNHEGMRADYPPRVHFNGFNDWNLNISVFAWYFPGDFWKYQKWLQMTCLEIMRRFRDEEIEFAFPTQTVYQLATEDPDKKRSVKTVQPNSRGRVRGRGGPAGMQMDAFQQTPEPGAEANGGE